MAEESAQLNLILKRPHISDLMPFVTSVYDNIQTPSGETKRLSNEFLFGHLIDIFNIIPQEICGLQPVR